MKRNRRHRRKTNAEVNLGFQIAPMIDVVFVILLFFIVQASDIQVETAVRVEDDGQVYLNDDPLDTPESKNLPELASNLNQLRESSEASKTEVLVTIYANNLALYERVVDVLDALSRAKVSNVSFQAGSSD
jgi:biopolymer transport protein ExbD